jgi:hypothetical protein
MHTYTHTNSKFQFYVKDEANVSNGIVLLHIFTKFYFYMLLCGSSALKEKTVHSCMTCCARVRLHTAAQQMFACQRLAPFVIKQR